jgi:hypothetical protein
VPGPQSTRKTRHYSPFKGGHPRRESKHMRRVATMQARRIESWEAINKKLPGFHKPGSQNLRKGGWGKGKR